MLKKRNKKKCIGCLKKVKDKINSLGMATICEKCAFPLEKVPDKLKQPRKCHYCKGDLNLIGVFIGKGVLLVYFDCPNSDCSRKRIAIVTAGETNEIFII